MWFEMAGRTRFLDVFIKNTSRVVKKNVTENGGQDTFFGCFHTAESETWMPLGGESVAAQVCNKWLHTIASSVGNEACKMFSLYFFAPLSTREV